MFHVISNTVGIGTLVIHVISGGRVQNSCRRYSQQILDLAGDFRFHDTVQDQRVIGDFFTDWVVLTKYKIINEKKFHSEVKLTFAR